MDILNAFVRLTPLTIAVFVFVTLMVYKKPLSEILEHAKHLRYKGKDHEIIVSRDEDKEDQGAATGGESQPSEATLEQVAMCDDESEGQRHHLLAIMEALQEGAGDAARESFEELQRETEDPSEQTTNELFYNLLLFQCGVDTTALDKLHQMLGNTSTDSQVYRAIGGCYHFAGEYDQSAEAYLKAVEASSDEPSRIRCVCYAAKSLAQAGKGEEALRLVLSYITQAKTSESKYEVFSGLASVYEIMGNTEMYALALDKSLEFRPNDTANRFSAAYAYGELEHEDLALYHYEKLLGFDQNHAASLNNAGVAYTKSGLPILGVAAYKRGADQGNSLASANLAFRYLNAGFKSEAIETLNQVREQPQPHEDIGKALAAATENEATESKKKKALMEQAEYQRRFLVAYTDAHFDQGDTIPSFEKIWVSTNRTIEMSVEQVDDNIKAHWNEGETVFTISGEVTARSAKITRFKKNPAPPMRSEQTRESKFIKDGNGYAYISPDGQNLNVLIFSNLNEHSILTLE